MKKWALVIANNATKNVFLEIASAETMTEAIIRARKRFRNSPNYTVLSAVEIKFR